MGRGGAVPGVQSALAGGRVRGVGSPGVLGRGFSLLRTGGGRGLTWTRCPRTFGVTRCRSARIAANTEIVRKLVNSRM